jgi:membrane associated rhomboid family serine protease
VVTLALVAANLLVFLIEVSQRGEIDTFVQRWGLVPADVHEGAAAAITLLTSSFLHAGWLHLVANMVYLGVFGPPVERRLGPVRYLALYFLSALVGSMAYVLAQPLSQTPAVGASGAISGIIAARLVLFLHVVDSTPTLLLLLLWIAAQLFSSVASLTTTTGIAWWAHLGGFACGAVLASLFRGQRVAK